MNLKRLIEANFYSVRSLAKEAGLSSSYLAEIVRGERPYEAVTYGKLEKIAKVFGLTVDELVKGEDPEI